MPLRSPKHYLKCRCDQKLGKTEPQNPFQSGCVRACITCVCMYNVCALVCDRACITYVRVCACVTYVRVCVCVRAFVLRMRSKLHFVIFRGHVGLRFAVCPAIIKVCILFFV